jgi:hypothetical protein
MPRQLQGEAGFEEGVGLERPRREVAPGVVIVVKLFDAQRPHPKSVP